jgi:hypothetical protein
VKVEADFASDLRFLFTIIPGQIRFWGTAYRTCQFIRYITFNSSESGFNGLAITLFIIGNEIIPFPILFIGNDTRKLIYFEFLVFRGM